METLKPKKLKTGDIVGVISPSLPVFWKKNLTRGMKNLESMGFKPKLGAKALEVHGGYQAGTKEDRLSDLHAMFLDDEVEAIFCAGGGYSCIQMLQGMDWDLIEKHPKIFIGYSDISTLLNPINKKTGLITFHGPTVEGGLSSDLGTLFEIKDRSLGKGKKFMLKSMRDALMVGEKGPLQGFTEWKVLRPGRAEGQLVGGNLDVLTSLLGSPYEPDWDGKILFWEDTALTIEDLDNFLWRLRISKVFKKIEGMIVGKITDLASIDDETEGWANLDKAPLIEDIVLQATEGYNFPILYGVDVGHNVPLMTFPIGAKTLLDCPRLGRVGKISILEKYLS